MKWTTHSIFGATVAAWMLVIFQVGLMPFVVLMGALGALFPDIDHPNSKVSNANFIMKIVSFFAIILISLFNMVFNFFGGLISSVTGLKFKELTGVHRSPATHSLLAVGLFAILLLPLTFAIPMWWYWGLLAGVFSHVLIDSFNPSGTPMFWPIRQSRSRFIPEALAPTTGTAGEGLVTIVVIILLALGLLFNLTGSGLSVADFEELFGGAISGKEIKAQDLPSYDFSKVDTKLLPEGSVRLPNGDVVLSDGVLLSELNEKQLEERGVNKAVVTSVGFTPEEQAVIKGGFERFLDETGILNLFRNLVKQRDEDLIPKDFTVPGVKK